MYVLARPFPSCSADGSCQDSSCRVRLTHSGVLALVASGNIRRKAPLQQLCGQKRKNSMNGELGNRRQNLSQLHRDLDTRLHYYFLVQAGCNPARNLPQSKEHLVQATIFLIEFMQSIIFHLMKQEGEAQGQLRCMQLQQLVSSLQQQSQTFEQKLQATRQENQVLEERNRTFELQLKSHDPGSRTPKSETASLLPLSTFPENKPTENSNSRPGVRVLYEDIDALSPKSARRESWIGSSQPLGQSLLNATPMTEPPPSLSFLSSTLSPPPWRGS